MSLDIGQLDFIIHIAAATHVDRSLFLLLPVILLPARSIEAPVEFLWDNVVGTVNILDFARKTQPNLGILTIIIAFLLQINYSYQ